MTGSLRLRLNCKQIVNFFFIMYSFPKMYTVQKKGDGNTASIALFVKSVLVIDQLGILVVPAVELSDLLADRLGSLSAHCLEVCLTSGRAHIKQELICKGSVLNIGKDLLHCLSRLIRDELRTGNIITELSRVGNRVAHALETGLIDEVDNELHLVDALEICVSRIIARLNQRIETCLHQCANTAAEDSLLTEEIGLGLDAIGRLQQTRSRAADCRAVCECLLQCLDPVPSARSS